MNYNHEEALKEAKKELGVAGETSITTKTKGNDDIITLELSDREIVLDFSKMTGKTILSAKNKLQEIKRKSKGFTIDELDDSYYILIAEKASGIKYDELVNLGIKDFIKVKNAVRDFLTED